MCAHSIFIFMYYCLFVSRFHFCPWRRQFFFRFPSYEFGCPFGTVSLFFAMGLVSCDVIKPTKKPPLLNLLLLLIMNLTIMFFILTFMIVALSAFIAFAWTVSQITLSTPTSRSSSTCYRAAWPLAPTGPRSLIWKQRH